MAGHYKWSIVKRLKGAINRKHGSLISKLAKEVIIVSRIGDTKADGNPPLQRASLPASTTLRFDVKRILKISLRVAANEMASNDSWHASTALGAWYDAVAEVSETAGVATQSLKRLPVRAMTMPIHDDGIATQIVIFGTPEEVLARISG